MAVDLLEELLTEMVFLEQMTKLQDGGLIRHRLRPKIDADKAAHGLGIIQRFFLSWIGEVEPLLEEIYAQHALQAHWRSAVLALGIIGRNDRAEILPGHDLLPIGKKLLATGGLHVGLEGAHG